MPPRNRSVLLVNGYAADDRARHVVDATATILADRGRTVDRLDLHDRGFVMAMSAEEHAAYETAAPIIDDDVQAVADRLLRAGSIVVCHPEVLYGVPPIVKGWLDRVLVPGVAFTFSKSGRVQPGLSHVTRLASVSTAATSSGEFRRAGALTRRTLGRTLWLSCNRRCRRTFCRLPHDVTTSEATSRLVGAFRRW